MATERRWPTNLDTRLCPDEERTRSPFTDCESIKEPYTVEAKSERRDRIAFRIRTDSGRAGWIEYIDYMTASESDSDHQARLTRDASAKKAKAECDRRGGIAIGMTRAEVLVSCWGKPQRVNTTRTASSDHEQFVYPGYNYVYLRNGVVTSIQTSR